MKKAILWIAALVIVLSLSACDTTKEPPVEVPEKPVVDIPQSPTDDTTTPDSEEIDVADPIEEEQPEDNDDEVVLVKMNQEEAMDAYQTMRDRMENESPVDIYDDMMTLLPQMPENIGAIQFAKFEQYMQNWSMNYSDQMYFEDGPMSDLWKSIDQAYDYETDSYDFDKMENVTHAEITKSLFKSGFKFIWLEGSPYPFIDYAQLKSLGDSIPEEVMAFILILADESDQISSADAGLVISWNELASRAVKTESALKIVKNEELHAKLESLYRFYAGTYMLGMNNTPVVNWEDNKLQPMVLESYESTMVNHTGSELSKMIEKYMSALKKLDFILPYSDQEQFQAIVKLQSDWIEEATENLHKH